MIILKLATNGLDLIKLETSLVTSDNKKSVSLEVTFDDSWTGYGKSATFKSSSSDKIYEVPLADDACVVPWEVLESVGIMSVGVRGVKDDGSVVASDLVDYKIAQGAKTGDGTSEDPTPTVYEQLLSNYSSVDQKITKEIQDRANAISKEKYERMTEVDVERKRIDNIIKLPSGSTSGDAELSDIRIGADGNTYDSAGTAVRGQTSKLSESITEISDVLNKETTLSPNVFNPLNVERGVNLSATGEITANASYCVTERIPTNGNQKVYIARLTNTGGFTKGVSGYICKYRSDNTLIGSRITQASPNEWDLESDCAYIRVSFPIAYLDYTFEVSFSEITNSNIVDYNEPYTTYEVIDEDARRKTNENKQSIESILENLNVKLYSNTFLRYPLLANVRTDIYFDNVAYGMSGKFAGFFSGNCKNHKRSISINPTDSTNQATLALQANLNFQNNDLTSVCNITTVNVPSTMGSGTKKVMLIGDSFTDQGHYQNFVNEYFKTDNVKVEWLGTKESTYGLKNEGRSGWRAYVYTHYSRLNGTENEGYAYENPFWNPSTSKFDFSYYMNQQGYSGVDIVFINLGINDVIRSTNTDDASLLRDWKTMVDSIKAYDSNIKIVLWMCPLPCIANGTGSVKAAMVGRYRMHEVILNEWRKSGWGYNNVYILPVYLCIDPVYDFPFEEVSIDDYNTDVKVIETTDTTHLSMNGYHHLANPIIAMIKYLASL